MVRVVGLVLLIAASAASAAPEPIDLQPSGPWKIAYGENVCLLSRPYTDGKAVSELLLTFEPVQKDVWLRLASPEPRRSRDDGDAAVEVDGRKLPDPVHFNTYSNASGGTTREFWLRTFDQVRPAQETLHFSPKGRSDLTFRSLGFQAGLRAADACMDDLHRSLGIDPKLLKEIAVAPEGYVGEFVDLPEFNDEFHFQILFWVTPEGRVDDCHLLAPTGQADFDKNVCTQLKKKGRFKPARDAAGAAIRAPLYENANIRKTIIRS